MKTLQKTKVVFWAALLFLGLWNENVLTGWAAGAKEQVLMQLETEAAVYEEATEDSIVVATLPKGTAVICMETESQEWYQVTYQEIAGFVKAESVGMYGDAAELSGEFEEVHEENTAQLEAAEAAEQQEKSQFLWGTVMAVLVALMFATGIFTVLRGRNKTVSTKKDNKTKEKQ